ncbi:Acg family FMN-binding oxidoreductase [Prauserella alba]|uniref:Nitroreductase family protein n=1 Tax=Prauserella alba TaxID=176898 RepID=A0ABP4FQA0_9PSEU|nr:nitroreductase [Prauserella alba]MCP2180324.1 Nitroreductase family protein [Prauserella alba]
MNVRQVLSGPAGVAVRAGIRAPSQHNTQPWRFRVLADGVEVLRDTDRVLEHGDDDGRGADLACGAVLCNMRAALAAAGHACAVEVLPDGQRTELAGIVWFTGPRRPGPEELALGTAVARRVTNRRPFADRAVPTSLRRRLTGAAEADGARLVLLSPAELDTFAALLRRADHLLERDAAYRAELAAWTHDGERPDGVPASAGGPCPAPGTLLAMRDFGAARRGADERPAAQRAFERDPCVAVLTTTGDTRRHRIGAGIALEHVLLAATSRGLSASFLPQPVEVESTRFELTTALGGRGYPQTALRLGYGYPGATTPRRPVEDVTSYAG